MLQIKYMKLLIATTAILVALIALYIYMAFTAEPSEIEVPAATRTVSLYYYDPAADTDETGNILCSREGLVAVEREVAEDASIEDVIRLHLEGNLTTDERARGITTEFPLAGLELIDASLANGTLTLTFEDPNGQTGGGSCRVAVLWMQIQSTAMQFSEVSSVEFSPEELFQP